MVASFKGCVISFSIYADYSTGMHNIQMCLYIMQPILRLNLGEGSCVFFCFFCKSAHLLKIKGVFCIIEKRKKRCFWI